MPKQGSNKTAVLSIRLDVRHLAALALIDDEKFPHAEKNYSALLRRLLEKFHEGVELPSTAASIVVLNKLGYGSANHGRRADKALREALDVESKIDEVLDLDEIEPLEGHNG